MEGAVTSALLCADAIRSDMNMGTPVEVLEPTTKPRILLVLLKYLLLPGALLALLISSLVGRRTDA